MAIDPRRRWAARALDFCISHGASIWAVVKTVVPAGLGAVVTGWAAALEDLPHPRLSLVLAAVVGAILGLIVTRLGVWVWTKFITAAALRRFYAASDRINPAEPSFSQVRLSPNDLIPPGSNWVIQKKFSNCEIVGPAIVVLVTDNPTQRCRYVGCEGIAGPNSYTRWPQNAVLMTGCNFTDCTFYRITFIIAEQAVGNSQSFGLHWISILPERIVRADQKLPELEPPKEPE